MIHVTNNNGDNSIVFTGKMFSLRGVDSATGHVVVNTNCYETFKFIRTNAYVYNLLVIWCLNGRSNLITVVE